MYEYVYIYIYVYAEGERKTEMWWPTSLHQGMSSWTRMSKKRNGLLLLERSRDAHNEDLHIYIYIHVCMYIHTHVYIERKIYSQMVNYALCNVVDWCRMV